jgi:nicotinamidase-related amidase
VSGSNLLSPEGTALVVIDVQERLQPHIHEGEAVLSNCLRLVEGMKLLGVPALLTEQYPRGLGPTVPALRQALGGSQVIEKREFSACGCQEFLKAAKVFRRLLLCGVETHVCVNQTAQDALDAGLEVHVATDAVSSRAPLSHQVGIAKMERAGAVITTVETALFELLRTSTHPQFKAVSALIR